MPTTSNTFSGAGNLVLTCNSHDTDFKVSINGTYGTLSFAVYGSDENSPVHYFPVAMINDGTIAKTTGNVTPSDNASASYSGDTRNWANIKFVVNSLASGSVNVRITSGSYTAAANRWTLTTS